MRRNSVDFMYMCAKEIVKCKSKASLFRTYIYIQRKHKVIYTHLCSHSKIVPRLALKGGDS